MNIPRPEYPRPQFVRTDWLSLNGMWEFEIDQGDSGLERGLLKRPLNSSITVPFCPESSLSGIGNTDFLNAVWYRRTVTLPEAWAGRNILLHFQAVDYDTTVWVDGKEVTRHRGGFTPFTAELGKIAPSSKPIEIVVRARDDARSPGPRGKQSRIFDRYSCFYTRTTGIWQTVWLEPVPDIALRRPRITPDVANSLLRLELPITRNLPGLQARVSLSDATGVITTQTTRADLDLTARVDLFIPKERRRLWSPEDPCLYDLRIELLSGTGAIIDTAESYAGLRSVAIDGQRVLINGISVFQRLVLDQGFYPDGILTAPTEQALIDDIKLSMDAGFNGARLHQKVFEERFLYHADRLGYLAWGEFPDWGCSEAHARPDHREFGITYAAQWLESLERDYSHPCIVGWCGLNETAQPLVDRITGLDDATRALFLAAKAMDKTRPVLDASGYSHRVAETDIYDSHDYIGEQSFDEGIAKFRERHASEPFSAYVNDAGEHPSSLPYRGQPYFVSEFGGFRWAAGRADEPESWGYGSDPVSEEDFYRRFQAVCDVLLDNPHMFGYCYTQLTDVFQEENGIFAFDRTPKFDLQRIRRIQQRQAAIETAVEPPRSRVS